MRKTLWGALLLGAACLISFRSTYEPDLWWHLAQGREAAAGHLVRTNLFSLVYRDYPQPYTSWLFDLGSYVLWTRIGPAGIQALQAVLLAATLGLVARACRVRASLASAIAVCALGWVILEPRALPRPHLASFVGIALTTLCIERARRGRSSRPLLWMPLIVAAWANVHVECVFGIAALGLFGTGEWLRPCDLRRRDAVRAIGIAAICLAATAATPYGFGLLRYTLENSAVPQLLDIAELHPPYLPNYRGFYAWAVLTVLLVGLRWRQVSFSDLLTLLAFGALGGRYLRLTPLLFLTSAPLIARCLDEMEFLRSNRRMAAAVAVGGALLLSRVPVPALVRGLEVGGQALEPPDVFSEPAMRYAREHGLSGPAFTSINLGGYVAWKLYPTAFVFIDSRLQAYPPAHFLGVSRAALDRNAWDALTAGVDWAVLSVPRINPFSGTGRFDESAWATAYRDAAIEIIVRRHGRYGALARTD